MFVWSVDIPAKSYSTIPNATYSTFAFASLVYFPLLPFHTFLLPLQVELTDGIRVAVSYLKLIADDMYAFYTWIPFQEHFLCRFSFSSVPPIVSESRRMPDAVKRCLTPAQKKSPVFVAPPPTPSKRSPKSSHVFEIIDAVAKGFCFLFFNQSFYTVFLLREVTNTLTV